MFSKYVFPFMRTSFLETSEQFVDLNCMFEQHIASILLGEKHKNWFVINNIPTFSRPSNSSHINFFVNIYCVTEDEMVKLIHTLQKQIDSSLFVSSGVFYHIGKKDSMKRYRSNDTMIFFLRQQN